MSMYFGTTEITNIDNLVPQAMQDITQAFFGSTEVFTVWGEYDGTLPAQYSANGSALADYRIYGASGGVGDRTINLVGGFTSTVYGDLTITARQDGALLLNGKNSQATTFFSTKITLSEGLYAMNNFLEIDNPGASTIRADIRAGSSTGSVIDDNKAIDNGAGVKFNVSSAEAGELFYVIRIAQNYLCNNVIIAPTLTRGTTIPIAHVPYGYEVDILTKSKNIFNCNGEWKKPYSGSTITVSNTVVTITGTWFVYQVIDVTPNTDYYISFDILSFTVAFGCAIYGVNAGGTINNSDPISGRFQGSTTINSGGRTQIALLFYSGNSNAGTCVYDKILVERASESTEFQPYSNTTTPIYVGSSPLGEDEYVNYGEGKIYRRFPNIFDISSIINVKRNNVVTANGFSNIDNVITFTLTVGEHGVYSYNDELTFEPNVEYQLDFDVYLTGTSTSNYIAIALTNIAVTDLISNQYFNFEISKDSWVHANVSLTPTESAGMLRIQARNTGNYIQLKNVVLRKKGFQTADPPVPLPALPTVDGTTIVDYVGQSAEIPSRFVAKYRKEGF